MERWDIFAKLGIGVGGSISTYLWGGFDGLMVFLLSVVIIDFVSGLIAGGVEGKLSSAIGFKGIAKKLAIFIRVAVAHLIDNAIGDGSYLIRNASIFFYAANEVLSIIENAGRIGVPVPAVISQAVDVLKNKGGVK
ncbi:phage holin family protein [Cytobacillus sp. Hm23]